MTSLTVALAQINTRLGDVGANLEKHLALAADARARGADLIVFPELSLTGYMLQDLAPSVALRPTPEEPTLRRMLAASRDLDVVVGFVEQDEAHRLYISSAPICLGVRSFTFIASCTFRPTGCSRMADSSALDRLSAPSRRDSAVWAC